MIITGTVYGIGDAISRSPASAGVKVLIDGVNRIARWCGNELYLQHWLASASNNACDVAKKADCKAVDDGTD